MAQLTHPNGTVVSVADESVERLLRHGFTPVAKQTPAKKAAKRTAKKSA